MDTVAVVPGWRQRYVTWGYVVPIVVFGLFTSVEQWVPAAYPAIYTAKIACVTLALLAFSDQLLEVKPSGRVLVPALLVGLFVFAEWVGLEKIIPYPHIGQRSAFNPFAALPNPTWSTLFVAVRLYGLVLVVPVMEEIFWRSFLLRYLTSADYASVPIGGGSWSAFAIVAALFATAHPEWLVAIIAAVAYGLLIRRTKSLFACVVAHAVTNGALGAYVLLTGNWQFW